MPFFRKRTWVYLSHKLWRIFVFSLLISILALSSAYAFFQNLAHYRSDIEIWLGGLLRQSVKVARIETRWETWSPVMELGRVEMLDTEGRATRFERIQVVFNPIASALRGRLVTDNIIITGARLHIYQRPGNGFSITGGRAGGGAQSSSSWLLEQSHLTLEAEQLLWMDGENRSHLFEDARVELFRIQEQHEVHARLNLPRSAHQLKNDLYARGGVLQIKANAHWSLNRLVNIQGHFKLRNLHLESKRHTSRLEYLGGLFNFARSGADWRLALARLDVNMNGEAWPRTHMYVKAERNADGKFKVQGELGFLLLHPLLSTAAALSSTSRERTDLLEKLQVRAELRGINFSYAEDTWHLESRIEKWYSNAWRNMPALRNWNAVLRLKPREGALQLQGTHAALDFSKLFGHPFQLSEVDGEIQWRREKTGIHANLELQGASTEIKGIRVHGSLYEQENRLYSDLNLSFSEAALRNVHLYVPDRGVNQKTMTWLRRGLRGGDIREARGVLRGPLDKLPFDKGEGLMELRAQVYNADVDYETAWPALSRVDAEVVLRGRGIRIAARRGMIGKVNVLPTLVEIADYTTKQAWLNVKGQAQGAAAAGLQFVNDSPLRKNLALDHKAVQIGGDIVLDLDLDIPLAHGEETRTTGTIHFTDNSVHSVGLGMTLEQVNGRLSFDNKGLEGRNMHAHLFGKAVDFSLYTGVEKELPFTRAELAGRADAEFLQALARHLEPSLEWGKLQDTVGGEADWQAFFQFPGKAEGASLPTRVEVNSNLRGLAVNLPAPLTKPAPAAKPFRLALELLKPHNHLQSLELNYGADVRLRRQRGETGEFHSTLYFGAAEQAWDKPPQTGFSISGKLPKFSVSAWRDLALGGGGASSMQGSIEVDLDITRFEAGGRHFNNMRIHGNSRGAHWGFSFNAQEAEGAGNYNPAQKSLDLSLERLVLKSPPSSPQENEGAILSPAALPALNLNCKDLVWGEYALGRLEWRSLPVKDGLELEHFSLSAGKTYIQGQGSWVELGREQNLSLYLDVESKDIHEFLQGFGFESGLKSEYLTLKAGLYWPGAPRRFELGRINGRFSLHSEKGRLTQVEPGLGRLFGVFGLLTAPHRLLSNLDGTLGEGFGFDTIEGDFILNETLLSTENLHIAGTAADIEIHGDTNLETRRYNNSVNIVPHASTALPVAGALLGGPQFGALALLLQQALKDPINRTAALHYRLHGSWDDPKFENLSDTEKQKAPAESDSGDF